MALLSCTEVGGGFFSFSEERGVLQVLVLQVCAHAAFACVCECARRV